MEYYENFLNDGVNSFDHYGILGMKWGVRRDRKGGSISKVSKKKKKTKKIKKPAEKGRVSKFISKWSPNNWKNLTFGDKFNAISWGSAFIGGIPGSLLATSIYYLATPDSKEKREFVENYGKKNPKSK